MIVPNLKSFIFFLSSSESSELTGKNQVLSCFVESIMKIDEKSMNRLIDVGWSD